MATRLSGKVALVTGAGSSGPGWGNGKATAVLFAREGAQVCALDLNPKAAEETCDIISGEGGDCIAVTADVADRASVQAAVDRCLDTYGRIDVLHNNVGIATVGGVADTEEEDWDRINDVNVKGIYLTCGAVVPEMVRQGGGAIVNVSSISGIRWTGVPMAAYAASKAAIIGLTRNIAINHAAQNIRCNAVLPGLMNTPMVRNALAGFYAAGDVDRMIAIRDAQSPTGRMGDAWDVAHAALFLASDEARYVNGVALPVDGGLSATCIAG